MKEDKIRSFLKEKRLLKKITDNETIFEKVITDCIKIKKEKVLIITDKGHNDHNLPFAIAYGYYSACKKLGLKVELIIQRPKKRGDKAGGNVVRALLKLRKKSVIILSLSNRLGKISKLGKSYRKFTRERGHKYISSTGLASVKNSQILKLVEALDTDYQGLKEKCMDVKKRLDAAKEIQIKTSKGTNLRIDVDGMSAICNDGDYSVCEKGGNIPAGEVYIPVKGTSNVEGKVVIDVAAAWREGTLKIKSPIILEIKRGSVVDIKGDEEAKKLEKTLRWAEGKAKHPEYITKVSEIGLGLNKDAKPIGCTIMDEKSAGTAHIALGSNYWFGGDIYGIIHLDLVFSRPHLFIDGKEVKFINEKAT